MGAGSDAPGTLARRLLDGISLALVLLDGEARVQLANAAAGALFGGGPGALAGRALVELFDEDAAARASRSTPSATGTARAGSRSRPERRRRAGRSRRSSGRAWPARRRRG